MKIYDNLPKQGALNLRFKFLDDIYADGDVDCNGQNVFGFVLQTVKKFIITNELDDKEFMFTEIYNSFFSGALKKEDIKAICEKHTILSKISIKCKKIK